MEAGKQNATLKTLEKLAQGLEIKGHEFLIPNDEIFARMPGRPRKKQK